CHYLTPGIAHLWPGRQIMPSRDVCNCLPTSEVAPVGAKLRRNPKNKSRNEIAVLPVGTGNKNNRDLLNDHQD
ncbi:hypothetical protein WA026_005612, partial [Henosepilachna vigintioctopunctata]